MKSALVTLLAFVSSTAFANFPECLEVSPYPLSPAKYREGAIIQGPIPFHFSEDGQIADRSGLESYDDSDPSRIVATFRREITGWGLGISTFLTKLTIHRVDGRPVRLMIEEDPTSLQDAYCNMDADGKPRGEFVRLNGDSREYRVREQIDIEYGRGGRTCRALIRQPVYAPVFIIRSPEPCTTI